MTLARNNPEHGPTPERLAAYADGELHPADAEATEAWLREHPDAAAEVQSLRQLAGLLQEHAAVEPGPAAWDQTLKGIEDRLAAPKPAPQRGSVTLRLVLGLAAACLVGLLIARALWPTADKPGPIPVEPEEEPYAVATSDEIVIVSMDPRNAWNLVVGRPPIPGELEWANIDDVTLVDFKPNDDGQVPMMHTGGAVPDPLAAGSNAWRKPCRVSFPRTGSSSAAGCLPFCLPHRPSSPTTTR
jgi:hypothetical protein